MGKKFSVAEFQRTVTAKYGELEIGDYKFRSTLQLDDDVRTEVRDLNKMLADLAADDDDKQATDIIKEILLTVSVDRPATEEFVHGLNDAELLTLFQLYMEHTQAGEASSSPS